MLCEEMGRSPAVAPMAFNCAAPDTGNMEILHDHGTADQQEDWLQPLLDGEIRSCFSMTEPEVSGSDPTTLQTRAELDGDEWVINGHKWFTSGAVGASLAIAMVVTEPDAHPYARASMILVPIDNPGFNLVRPVPVMGHDGGPGHCEILYEDCRVPASNLLGERGAGFVIAQDRLGPGRIHHCMRAIGTAERAIEMMCDRANSREAFGEKLAEKQFVQDFIARSRMEVDQARLLTLAAAWKMDTAGKRAARQQISQIKVVAANMVMDVLDRAIQVHGSLGHVRRHPARRDVALQPDAEGRRRARRGPQDGDRPPRAEPLGEEAAGAGGGRRRNGARRGLSDHRRARLERRPNRRDDLRRLVAQLPPGGADDPVAGAREQGVPGAVALECLAGAVVPQPSVSTTTRSWRQRKSGWIQVSSRWSH